MQIFLIHNYNSINTNTHLSYTRLENLLSLMDSTIKLRYLEKEESYLSWKYEAYKSIKNSHVILFISNQEVTSKNMEWELKLAYKLEKPILNINFETLNQNIDIYEYIYLKGLTETITQAQLNKLVEYFKIIDKRVASVNDSADIL